MFADHAPGCGLAVRWTGALLMVAAFVVAYLVVFGGCGGARDSYSDAGVSDSDMANHAPIEWGGGGFSSGHQRQCELDGCGGPELKFTFATNPVFE